MGDRVTSSTERESNFMERLFDDHHYRTTISDGKRTVSRCGWTSEESERNASEEWEDDDD